MRRLPQANYQLFVGVVIGLICSFCLNEIFRSSITTWRTTDIPERRKLAKYNFEKTVPPTIQSKNQSFNDVRVLCWVLTCPQNHRTRAIHVKRTWGKRCDKLLFISTEEDSAIDVIAVPGMPSGRDGLWGKTKAALKYAWEHHKDEFDWFMKADDDTYVIVENLKKFLSNYSRTDPVFFGCQFSAKEIPAWTSGGAGYVLSAEALRRFALDGLPNPENCKVDNDGSEDAELAKCLLRVGVTLEDSRDSFGRHRFLAFTPADHLFPRTLTEADKKYWYWQDLTYPQVQGMDCCASDAISYHYITSREMYVLEYFLYHIRPAGVDQEEKYVQEYPLEFVELTTATPTSTKPTSSKPISTKSTATKPTSTKTTSAKPNPTKHKPSSTVGINQSKSSKSTESAIIV